jgi:squalene-hopene/tetraprenyl-beta-curcumene cyclase
MDVPRHPGFDRDECRNRYDLSVVRGDWSDGHPQLAPGGWAFQYNNPYYPDLDDTAVVAMAMHRAGGALQTTRYEDAVARARRWIEGLQSGSGGWAAFDADNDSTFLRNVPFFEAGALLDPPTPDLTARCVWMLAACGGSISVLERGVAFLRHAQRPDGTWFGRWGMNRIYGTWPALTALRGAGVASDAPIVRQAAPSWLVI